MSYTLKLKIFSTATALLLLGSLPGYADNKPKQIIRGAKAVTGEMGDAISTRVARAVSTKATPVQSRRVPGTIAADFSPAHRGPNMGKIASSRVTANVPHASAAVTHTTPVGTAAHQAPKYVTAGHPLTALLPSAYLYEKGVDLGKVTEYLMNESLDAVAAAPLAWDVRKEIHRTCQSALGFTPEFLYTNRTVNDMLDVLSFEQFMLKHEGKFPLAFAQTAAEDGVGEQMTTFLMNHYLLNSGKTMQISDYLWNLYAKSPNGRPVEEIVTDVEAFVAEHNRLPGIVFFASSEQVAPVIRSAMDMSPEEIALGTEMLLVTHVYSWGWDLSGDLSKRVRAIYNQVEDVKTSWRGNDTPDRVATAPNR